MKKITMWLVALCTCSITFGQLTIGDQLPELVMRNSFQQGKPRIRLGDYQGKLLILDFWGTGCGACLTAFAKMDTLQQQLRDKIQVVFVNSESEDSVVKYFTRFNRIKRPDIPMVTGDTVLSSLFPHLTVPHHVWIGPTGKVVAITDSHNTSVATIEQFFRDGYISLRVKKEIEDFNYHQPLPIEGGGRWWDQMIAYRYLMHMPAGIRPLMERSQQRILLPGYSVKELYAQAFNAVDRHFFKDMNILLKIQDPYPYEAPANMLEFDHWEERYNYYYALQKAPDDTTDIFSLMRKDLEAQFGIRGHIEQSKFRAFVLVKDKDLLGTKGGKPGTNLYSKNKEKYIQNLPASLMINAIRSILYSNHRDYLFRDESGLKGNIDIRFHADDFYGDLPRLNQFLKKYGLRVVERIVEDELLVLEKI